ncbi:hypothetical protein S7335_400 [Synechococcus sp. PCC 7335]|uniref:hypothetical protein n=1 Tax=Synechococcus sp. (strain ATCC 29403 / PCC 7335) TaxID=91464 RepID=UPI00017EC7F2|nr:hypothetical protein [Synechococcus sp. PCC 7335]EDX83221.1 hypothetical protein S7335_400 [Synechococcus sp. PCC 7335]
MSFLALKAGLFYFLAVFSAGFVLGVARILWVVPRFGARAAELMEMPIMLIVMVGSAAFIIRRWAVPSDLPARLCMGLTALGLLLFAEFGAVLQLRGLSISEYLESRDPVSGTVYYLMLLILAALPCFIGQRSNRPPEISK